MVLSAKAVTAIVALLVSGQGRDFGRVGRYTARRIVKAAAKHHPENVVLFLSTLAKESGFHVRSCYKGAHGLGQVQLKDRSCSPEAVRRANKLGLYNVDRAVRSASTLARQWRRFCLKAHKGEHDWLLHYNQGFGFCRRKKCSQADYHPITRGHIGGYGRRVRGICHRMMKRLPEKLRKEAGKCDRLPQKQE